MFDIGFLELMVIGVLGLLVLGPERLPGAARSVGLMVGKVRRTINGFQDELERQVRTEELQKKLQDPYATFMDEDASKNAPSIQPPPADSGSTGVTTSESTADSSPEEPLHPYSPKPQSNTPSESESNDSTRKPEA
ncbi:MAG: Sec-independent protein translocase protein TatB [Oceanobacter sp.]